MDTAPPPLLFHEQERKDELQVERYIRAVRLREGWQLPSDKLCKMGMEALGMLSGARRGGFCGAGAAFSRKITPNSVG